CASAPRFAPDTPLGQVEILADYPGVSPALVAAVTHGGAQGLVWAGYGNGSVSSAVQPMLDEARRRGLAIVRASRVGAGRVWRDEAAGFVNASGLDPYKARIALMLALGAGMPRGRLQPLFDDLSYSW